MYYMRPGETSERRLEASKSTILFFCLRVCPRVKEINDEGEKKVMGRTERRGGAAKFFSPEFLQESLSDS